MRPAATLLAALLLGAAGFGCGDDEPSLMLEPLDLHVPPSDSADAGAPPSSDDGGNANHASVAVGFGAGNRFVPQTIFIHAGGSVTWRWVSGLHGIESDDTPAAFPPSPLQASGSYTVTFPSVGQLGYHCTVHGAMMTGVIVVQ